MKRQGRKKKGVPQKGGSGSFPIINNDAAGIDIGSEEHWVAVPEDRDENPVRPFGCFTADLHAMARWSVWRPSHRPDVDKAGGMGNATS
jgi:hypothetical protein